MGLEGSGGAHGLFDVSAHGAAGGQAGGKSRIHPGAGTLASLRAGAGAVRKATRRLMLQGILAVACGGIGWSAHCTTVLNQQALPQYQGYVARAEQAMAARWAKGDLAWVPEG